MKPTIALLTTFFFLHPLYASDGQTQTASFTGAVVSPDGKVIPTFTVVVRPRSDKPQLIKRMHCTNGIFELTGLAEERYKLQIFSPSYASAVIDLDFSSRDMTSDFRLIMLQAVRNETGLEGNTRFSFRSRESNPDSRAAAEAAYENGLRLYRQGELEGAIQAYGEAIGKSPDDVNALNDIGAIYVELGRPDSALLFLRRAARIDPQNVAVRMNTAGALVKQRNYSEGMRILQEILSEHEGMTGVRFSIARAYWEQGMYEAAESTLRQTMEQKPELVEGWIMLLNLALEQGNTAMESDALVHVRTLLDTHNNHALSQFVDRLIAKLDSSNTVTSSEF